MTFSTSFSNRLLLAVGAACLLLAGCSARRAQAELPAVAGPAVKVAVLPVENLSTNSAPVREVQQALQEKLRDSGVEVVPDGVVEGTMTKNRIRYTGGVSTDVAGALQRDAGVDRILVSTVELYDEELPLKMALTARLVTAGDNPAVLWMESVALTGDEAPGFLGLGRITDMRVLRERGLNLIMDSLGRHLSGKEPVQTELARKFRPKRTYNAFALEQGTRPTIAVLPFLNESTRRYAGEFAALHFVRELTRGDLLRPIEPGIVRDKMLAMRIIMNDGVSLAAADIMANTLDTDYLLTGKVFDYHDSRGGQRNNKVEFSVQVIERVSRKIVWSSRSSNASQDGMYFFDLGRLSTAHAAAARLTRSVVAQMAQEQ